MLPNLSSLSLCRDVAAPPPHPALRAPTPFALSDLPRELRAKTIAKYIASLIDSPGGGESACTAVKDWCEDSGYVFAEKEKDKSRTNPCADEAVWKEVADTLGLSELAARKKEDGEKWSAFLVRWCGLHAYETEIESDRSSLFVGMPLYRKFLAPDANMLPALQRIEFSSGEIEFYEGVKDAEKKVNTEWAPFLSDFTIHRVVRSALRNNDTHVHYGPIEMFDVSRVTTMNILFAFSSFNGDLSRWDVSNVKHMSGMFVKAEYFEGRGLERWNVSKVKIMSQMFRLASVFNADLSRWNVSSVTDMFYMFAYASNFNNLGETLSHWNVSSVTNMMGMFDNAVLFEGQGLRQWNVSSVKNTERMFSSAFAFKGVLGRWDVSSVTEMMGMFADAKSFNGYGLERWDVSSVNNMQFMFKNAVKFDEELSRWNVSSSTKTSWMFDGATSYDPEFAIGSQRHLPPLAPRSPLRALDPLPPLPPLPDLPQSMQNGQD